MAKSHSRFFDACVKHRNTRPSRQRTSSSHTIDQAFVIGSTALWQAIEAGSSGHEESGKPLKFGEKLQASLL
jgi:hypothetical protein